MGCSPSRPGPLITKAATIDQASVEGVTTKSKTASFRRNSFQLSADAEENSLLADVDCNVVSSFRRAKSRVSSLFDRKIRLPGSEDKIIVYFTSLRGIRRTFEDCYAVRNIFRGFPVSVDERDISMDFGYRIELQNVLGKNIVSLPQVFISGRHIGGAEEIKQLYEFGDLAKHLEGFPVRDLRFICESCGDARFFPCLNCNGSCKIFDEDEGQLRRCLECNENGLIRCPACSS
ncbi:hypothetical protein NE237_003263 [Protea cynaroides]|uniref:Glutaredoxin domain-containing protein n=1 Tax=Protea cynaroides TaxID=273540 RepID=A0A9Q0KH35_9MAGN|nr:hypothetical protein NE237_003263 [Protea cynaroides]